MEKRISLNELASVNYLDPNRARFFVENNDFLSLEYDGEIYHNVKLHRAMPFKLPDDYISVQDMELYQSEFISGEEPLNSNKISCEKIDNGHGEHIANDTNDQRQQKIVICAGRGGHKHTAAQFDQRHHRDQKQVYILVHLCSPC